MRYLLLAALLCSSCVPDDTQAKVTVPAPSAPAGRFTLVLVEKVHDYLAYADERGIYILTDTKTGEQFVGVSGIGITELGRHQTGKNTYVEDDR